MGFSLGEIVLLLVVGLIVVGPRKLPGLMRTAGQWVARLRRMSTDLRSQSGIDDLIRQEGLEQHLTELRSLSRMNVVDTLIAPAIAGSSAPMAPRPPMGALPRKRSEPLREREYPLVGCDAYGALPDDAMPYIPPKPHAAVADAAPAPGAAGADAPAIAATEDVAPAVAATEAAAPAVAATEDAAPAVAPTGATAPTVAATAEAAPAASEQAERSDA